MLSQSTWLCSEKAVTGDEVGEGNAFIEPLEVTPLFTVTAAYVAAVNVMAAIIRAITDSFAVFFNAIWFPTI